MGEMHRQNMGVGDWQQRANDGMNDRTVMLELAISPSILFTPFPSVGD